MADKVTFPCEYLVVESGYTSRLLTPNHLEEAADEANFDTFCANHGVIPLYVRDSIWGDTPEIVPIVIENGHINRNATPSEALRTLCESIDARLRDNGLSNDGVVVFRVGDFANASKVFLNMKSLEYCGMYDITNIEVLRNPQGAIDLVYVDIDAESG